MMEDMNKTNHTEESVQENLTDETMEEVAGGAALETAYLQISPHCLCKNPCGHAACSEVPSD